MDDRARQLRWSWEANAAAWVELVRSDGVKSRVLGTGRAIVETVVAHRPKAVLDVGCGEGWLCREMEQRGIRALGVDGSAALIQTARELGSSTFYICPHEFLGSIKFFGYQTFDAVVFNFSLFEADAASVLRSTRRHLNSSARLFIQTVHPWSVRGPSAYRDSWRIERFESLPEFVQPMPWYYRTVGSWVQQIHAAGFRVERVEEPLDEHSKDPLSIMFDCALT